MLAKTNDGLTNRSTPSLSVLTEEFGDVLIVLNAVALGKLVRPSFDLNV